jgi:zinc protease
VKRPLLLALLCAALWGAVACAKLPPLDVPGPTTAHPPSSLLSTPSHSGVRSLAMRNASSRVVAFRVAFMSGSSDDPVGKEGLTRLLAETMAEGGTEQHTYSELVQKLFPLAGAIDVHVDRDETVFTAEVPSDALEEFYPLLMEVLLAPRLASTDFERLHARALSELIDDLRGSNDEALGKEALAAAIFEGHPYGHPPVGTERGLANVTVEDLRAQRPHLFCRERVLAGVAGGFPEGFDVRMTQDLSELPACAADRSPLPPLSPRHGLSVLIVDKPSAESTAISIGAATELTRASDDFPAAIFVTDYVGLHRQATGLLYRELREKRGLNYGDFAYAEYFEQAGSTRSPMPNVARRQQLVSIWLRPVKPANALFALRGALSIYDQVLTSGIPSAEIERERSFLSRYVLLEQLTESRRLGYALDDMTYGAKLPYLDRLRDAWKRLDEASVREVMARYLSAKELTVAIVAKNGADLKGQLIKGDPTTPAYDAPKPADVVLRDKEIARYPLGLTKDNVRVVKVGELFK